jgi:peptide chain release factor 1
MRVSGKGARAFDQEAGGHRFQRVPPTERRGRVHTSTVTVSVFNAETESVTVFKKEDCQISFFSGTGPGGQNRNKVQASARIKHLPSGMVRTAQTRSRENSVRLAIGALETAWSAEHQRQQMFCENESRRAQVGSGMRGDKRRTYRLQDDRVIDHRTGREGRCSQILRGGVDLLHDAVNG